MNNRIGQTGLYKVATGPNKHKDILEALQIQFTLLQISLTTEMLGWRERVKQCPATASTNNISHIKIKKTDKYDTPVLAHIM